MAAPVAEGRPSQQLFVAETDAFVSASQLPEPPFSARI